MEAVSWCFKKKTIYKVWYVIKQKKTIKKNLFSNFMLQTII